MVDLQHSGRTVPRPFEMHWGSGWVVEEASASTPYAEPTVQLLEFEDGSQTLRFCYYHGPRFGRGPMMISEEHLDEFAASLEEAPRIRELLQRMLGA
ncbi:MAG: hypothetical protein V3S98_06635 [Dehalococcoidia bacterium]